MHRDEVFLTHRALLFSIAYDVTGSVGDAEDVVQEVYLRWRSTSIDVSNARAYLARMAANRAVDVLRAATRRREDYVGPWLPEPLRTGEGAAVATHPEESALLADAVSMAMLVVLERLTDDERVAFLLREVFDFPYAEVALALGRSEAAARQLVHRARDGVRSRQPRRTIERTTHRVVVDRFILAAASGDVEALVSLLAPDVELVGDGGGKASAALRPIVGADRTARLVLGLVSGRLGGATMELLELNGATGLVLRAGAAVIASVQFQIDGDAVRGVFIVRNPDKLARLA